MTEKGHRVVFFFLTLVNKIKKCSDHLSTHRASSPLLIMVSRKLGWKSIRKEGFVINVSMPLETLSLKCPCGYIKQDVVCLGEWHNYGQQILKFCGGLFILDWNGDDVTCRKCNKKAKVMEFHCSFCDKSTNIGVEYRVKGHTGRAVSMQMSVHKTVVLFN